MPILNPESPVPPRVYNSNPVIECFDTDATPQPKLFEHQSESRPVISKLNKYIVPFDEISQIEYKNSSFLNQVKNQM
jgi:hypothetical protein